jgi:hypothetical protein
LDRATPPTAGATAGSGGSGGSAGGAPVDVASAIVALAGPDAALIVGTDGGAVIGAASGEAHFFVGDPGTLVTAAAAVAMPVCSVEFAALAIPGPPDDPFGLTIDQARDACALADLGDVFATLQALKTDRTVVIFGANAAITVNTTNNGINAFYDADIVPLLHSARTLYVSVCLIQTEALALPTYPEGQTPGLSVDQALARCAP